MKEGILRNLRYQLRLFWQAMGTALGLTAVLLVWQALTTPLSYLAENLAISAVSFSVFTMLFTAMAIFMSMHTTLLPAALSMSSTRKATFWSSQLTRLLYAAGTVALGAAANGVVCLLLPGAAWLFGGRLALLAALATAALAGVAQLFGLVAHRFGKWGVLLYSVFFAVIGMGAGIFFAMSGKGDFYTVLKAGVGHLAGGWFTVGCLVQLVLVVVTAVATALLYRKADL